MIIKTLDFADVYKPLSPLIAPALEYLRQPNLARVKDGRYELKGEDLYAMVQSYDTAPAATKKWEAHRRYVDIQFVVSGEELMGYAPRAGLRETQPHDDGKDVAFLDVPAGKASFLRLPTGSLCILGPEDVHLPGVQIDKPAPVKKVVLKLATASFRS